MKCLLVIGLLSIIILASALPSRKDSRAARRRSRRPKCSLLERMTCWINLCESSYCSAYPEARCRLKVLACGCRSAWYTQWGEVDCDIQGQFRHSTGSGFGNTQAFAPAVQTQVQSGGECPHNVVRVSCRENPCWKVEIPGADCRPNYCGGCQADFYRNGLKVSCDRCSFPQDILPGSVKITDTRAYGNTQKARIGSGTGSSSQYPAVSDSYSPPLSSTGDMVRANSGLALGPQGGLASTGAVYTQGRVDSPNTVSKDTIVLPGTIDYSSNPTSVSVSGMFSPDATVQATGQYPAGTPDILVTPGITDTYTSDIGLPSTGTYPAGSPDVLGSTGLPDTYAPDVGVPSPGSYPAGSPDIMAPAGLTDTYAPDAALPSTGSYPTGSPVVSSPDLTVVFTPDVLPSPDLAGTLTQNVGTPVAGTYPASSPGVLTSPDGLGSSYVPDVAVQNGAIYPAGSQPDLGMFMPQVVRQGVGSFPAGSPDIMVSPVPAATSGTYAPDTGAPVVGNYPAGSPDIMINPVPAATSGTYAPDTGAPVVGAFPAGSPDIIVNPVNSATSGTYAPDTGSPVVGNYPAGSPDIMVNLVPAATAAIFAPGTGSPLVGAYPAGSPDIMVNPVPAATSGTYAPGAGAPVVGNYPEGSPGVIQTNPDPLGTPASYTPDTGLPAMGTFSADVICPPGQEPSVCSMDPCLNHRCERYPNAECRVPVCGNCQAKFFLNNTEVTDCEVCRPINVIETSCPANPCDVYSCPAHPTAVCRWTRCSSCKESWYMPEGEVACDVPAMDMPCTLQQHRQCTEKCSPTHCHSDLHSLCRIRGCGASCKKEYYKRVGGVITVVPCQLWGVWYDRSAP